MKLVYAALLGALIPTTALSTPRTLWVHGDNFEGFSFMPAMDDNSTPTTYYINRLLQSGTTAQICLYEHPLECRYVVPAKPLPKTHTEYNQYDCNGRYSCQWYVHSDPADYWKLGMQYRVCPVPLVETPDIQPDDACHIIPQDK